MPRPEPELAGGWCWRHIRQLGLSEVPAAQPDGPLRCHLRLLRLALNRMTDDAAWDREALGLEFSDVLELAPQADLEISGFEVAEIDVLRMAAGSNRKTNCRRSRPGPRR